MRFMHANPSLPARRWFAIALSIAAWGSFGREAVAQGQEGRSEFVRLIRPGRPPAAPIASGSPGRPSTVSPLRVDPTMRALPAASSPDLADSAITSAPWTTEELKFSSPRLELLKQNVLIQSPPARPSRPQASPTVPVR